MEEKTAENFILSDQNGDEFELYKNLDKNVLLVFYPKDDTPVCSKQLKDYYSHQKEFSEIGIKVVAVNIGSKNSHKSFCDKINFHSIILADVNKNVSRQFNALNIFGGNKRKLVLISKERKIIWETETLSFRYIKSVKILEVAKQLLLKEMT